MLNALEELRKIREAQGIQTQADPFQSDNPSLRNLPTNPTKEPAAVAVMPTSPHIAGVSAVLNLLATSSMPVSYPGIVKALSEQGQGKDAVKQAIAHCQSRGWIEHNLTTGYVLTSQL